MLVVSNSSPMGHIGLTYFDGDWGLHVFNLERFDPISAIAISLMFDAFDLLANPNPRYGLEVLENEHLI